MVVAKSRARALWDTDFAEWTELFRHDDGRNRVLRVFRVQKEDLVKRLCYSHNTD